MFDALSLDALSISALSHIILDVSYRYVINSPNQPYLDLTLLTRDAKKRHLFDIPETRDDVFKLLSTCLLKHLLSNHFTMAML